MNPPPAAPDPAADTDTDEAYAGQEQEDATEATDPEPARGVPGAPGGLLADLAGAAPRRWWNRGTVALAALLLVAGGFLGGAHTQRAFGGAGDQTPRAGRGAPDRGTGGFGGQGQNGQGQNGGGGQGQGRPGGGGTGGPGAAPLTGTVKLVDGTTLYVQTADGDIVTVRTDARTAVSLARPAPLRQLATGARVTVAGPAADDGTVTATAVTATAR